MRRRIISQLVRHSKKAKTLTGLSWPGIVEAGKAGMKLPKSHKVKGYHSEAPRAKSTLGFALEAFGEKGGKAYPKIRERKELGYWFIKNMAAIEKMIAAAKGNEDPVLRRWLDGKISKKITLGPKAAADAVIRKRFALGKRAVERGLGGMGKIPVKEAANKIILRNVSHSWITEAVLERLTGVRYTQIPPGTMVRENEKLEIIHTPKKAKLRYRGREFDVTKRLNEIIGQNESGK